MIQVRSLQKKKLIRCSSAKISSDLYILLNNLGPRLVKELFVTHVRALCKYDFCGKAKITMIMKLNRALCHLSRWTFDFICARA